LIMEKKVVHSFNKRLYLSQPRQGMEERKLKKHIIISPHLDDAVLSCGELIKKIVSKGEAVFVVTVFTGFPQSNDLSDAAKQYHSNCFLGDDSMIVRLKEDVKAMEYLGCTYQHLDYYECLYRRGRNGLHIYPDLQNIYYLDFTNEKDIFERLCNDMKKICYDTTVVYAPFGLGNHADHLLIRKVFDDIRVELSCIVYYYEEIPYICYYYKDGGNSDFEKALTSEIICFSNSEWKAKIEALKFYKSQLHIMWKTEEDRYQQLYDVSKKYNNQHSIRLWRL
jgi:LmbE family N-acetylglucosaminyl deacetylase